MASDDQELDDLLDNALSDFDKKLPANLQPSASAAASDVSIQKVNLYVDDVDYDDRPTTSSARSSAAASTQQSKPPTMPNLGPGLSSLLFNSATSQAPGGAPQTNIDDDMKMFEQIFGDEKTKANMQSLRDTLNMFKEGDENKLLENFDRVMTQITDSFKMGDLPDDKEGDDDDTDSILAGEENEMLRKMLADMQDQMKKVSSEVQTGQTASSGGAETAQANATAGATASPPLNPSSFFNAEFLSKLSKSKSSEAGGLGAGLDDDDDLDESEAMFMEPLLSMLFSKDILYPSLKMMLENFEKHLEEKKNEPENDEIKKLKEQRKCVVEMCEIYERSKPDDSKQAKSEQMKRIIDLLEKCGMPPSELVPEVNPFNSINPAENSCPIS